MNITTKLLASPKKAVNQIVDGTGFVAGGGMFLCFDVHELMAVPQQSAYMIMR
jgi:hypothetical protein